MPHPTTSHPHNDPAPLGQPFIELPSVDSTNNYAMAQAHAGLASHGMVVFAHEQFAGKGQRGKSWSVKPGQNITMSIVLEPFPLSISQQFELSATVAVAALDFMGRYLSLTNLFIKWPNDLYWGDRKAGGILIENSLSGDRWNYAVVGIGMNINQDQFDSRLPNPVSLKIASGKSYDTLALARELVQCLEIRYRELLAGNAQALLEVYNRHLYKRFQRVSLRRQGKLIHARIESVDPTGHLYISGEGEGKYAVGELEWVIAGNNRPAQDPT